MAAEAVVETSSSDKNVAQIWNQNRDETKLEVKRCLIK